MALNQKYTHNDHIALVAPEAIVSGQAVKIGAYVGVAQISADAGERVTVWLNGSYMLPVTGEVKQGDQINISDAGALSVSEEGSPFGIANADKPSSADEVEVAPFGMVPTFPAAPAGE